MKVKSATNHSLALVYFDDNPNAYIRATMPVNYRSGCWYILTQNDLLKLHEDESDPLEAALLAYIGELADMLKDKGE